MNLKLLILPILLGLGSSALAITPRVGTIIDMRSGQDFFSDLRVTLELLGDDVDDIQSIQVQLEKASDDTGKDLILKGSQMDKRYLKSNGKIVEVMLKNPSRRASKFNVSGVIKAFAPSKDTTSKIIVSDLLSKAGTELKHPALTAAKISFTLITNESNQKESEIENKKAVKAIEAQL